jgi:uncharacterized membrane protein YhfC
MTEPTVAFPPGWFASMVAAIALQVLLPVLLGFIAKRCLHVGWRYFAYGMLIFFLFQVVTRVPVIQFLQAAGSAVLRPASLLFWAWVFFTSLTAGICEEVGRWIGYRWLIREQERTWPVAVMYGLGHAGLESMLLVAGLSAVSLIGLLSLTAADLSQLSDERRTAVTTQLVILAAQPGWFPLLGAWERACTIVIHVCLSVMVLQVFRRRTMTWLWLAIAAHTFVNLVATGLLTVLGPARTSSAVMTEFIIGLLAVVAAWVAWRLRDQPSPSPIVARIGG